MMKRIFGAAAAVTALLLAGCGGGNGASISVTKTASDIVINDPVVIDRVAFLALAQGASCAERKNRLWIIDGKQVFWDRAGNSCPDANWSQTLYGASPDKRLCSSMDSIAGPQTRCDDESKRALFDTIVKNADAANLGLDSSHKVEAITITLPVIKPLAYTEIAKFSNNGMKGKQDLVIKDAASLSALWAVVTAGMGSGPQEPLVDFTRQMVVGVFPGANALTCGSDLDISRVSNQDGKLVVDYEVRRLNGPVACLPIVDGAAMVLVAIDRSDAQVQFVRHDVELVKTLMIHQSGDSGIHQAREIIVNDQSSWEQLWADHAGKDTPAPVIDFSRQVVLAMFAGPVNYCNGLLFDSVSNDGKQLSVNYFLTGPRPDTACIALVRYPATLVAIDRTALPIVFHKVPRVQ